MDHMYGAVPPCALRPLEYIAPTVPPGSEVVVITNGATLVSENVAGVATPVTVAFTEYEPTVPFAVKAVVAIPEASVVTVTVFVLPGKIALAPDEGAVNVTLTPGNGLFSESVTVAWSAVANAVLITAD
jgi:hypothetical protein